MMSRSKFSSNKLLMQIFTAALAASVPYTASAADSFLCTFNLKRGPQTQAFQLRQKLTIERNPINYRLADNRSVNVTQGEIPFEVYLGWDKLNAKIIYRHASELNAQGQMTRAAQWKCFEASIETVEGVETFSCGDKDRTDDPFNDPNQRWRPTEFSKGIPNWPQGYVFQERFASGDDTLTLECRTVSQFREFTQETKNK